MKLLGMIGGMSWESTIEYYRRLNEIVTNRLGSWNSAKLLLYSVNFEEILPLQNQGEWDKIAVIMLDISRNLQKAGCDAILICSNTMHKIAEMIEKELAIPLIHVIDATAEIIKKQQAHTLGLLGTKFTMEEGFYVERLRKNHDLRVLLPGKQDRAYIHDTIYNEFAQGKFKPKTKQKYLSIIEKLLGLGAEGIILGCTEIPLLIKPEDVKIPLFNTLEIHLKKAADFILK